MVVIDVVVYNYLIFLSSKPNAKQPLHKISYLSCFLLL
jgi:hypothetical protein